MYKYRRVETFPSRFRRPVAVIAAGLCCEKVTISMHSITAHETTAVSLAYLFCARRPLNSLPVSPCSLPFRSRPMPSPLSLSRSQTIILLRSARPRHPSVMNFELCMCCICISSKYMRYFREMSAVRARATHAIRVPEDRGNFRRRVILPTVYTRPCKTVMAVMKGRAKDSRLHYIRKK